MTEDLRQRSEEWFALDRVRHGGDGVAADLIRDLLARAEAAEQQLQALQQRIAACHRYTITSEGASRGYFRLVEDTNGAWVTWAEVAASLTQPGAAGRQESQ